MRESEERFRNLMEQSPISIQVHTPDGKLYQSNSAYAKLYALNKETLKELYERYNIREDQQALKLGVSSHIEKVFSGKRVLFPEYEYDGVDTLKTLDFNHPVSRKCWVQTRGFPVKDQSGQVVYAVFLSEDITTRKTAEEKLQESEESYRALIEQANDGIAVIQEGVITYSNEALTRLSGFDKGEMIGRSFEEFIGKQDHLQTVKENYIHRMNNDSAPSIYESGIIHKEGHHLDVEFNASKSVVNGKLTEYRDCQKYFPTKKATTAARRE